jgi:PAS domain S-box-containing protein
MHARLDQHHGRPHEQTTAQEGGTPRAIDGADPRSIIDGIPALIWSSCADGSADFFNRRYLDFMGSTRQRARGWGWIEAIHPDDTADLLVAWRRIVTSRKSGEVEARMRRFDGEYRWILFRLNPLLDDDGRIIRWYGVADEVAGNLRAELARMAKIHCVSALTASIAHEVNQPLSGIVTNASTCLRMLSAEPPNIGGAIETARRTIRDGHRAADIITRIRALFGKRASIAEHMDLNEVALEVIALSQSTLKHARATVETEFADDLPLVPGDRVQLQQVILNLLLNAAEAMRDIGDRPRRMIVRTEKYRGDYVRLIVKDSGVGIAPGDLAKCFGTFYSTKDGGMGIGLSISRSIIERHHGRLEASPNEGPGASFWFSIPHVTDDQAGDVRTAVTPAGHDP